MAAAPMTPLDGEVGPKRLHELLGVLDEPEQRERIFAAMFASFTAILDAGVDESDHATVFGLALGAYIGRCQARTDLRLSELAEAASERDAYWRAERSG
jgi:hypothetical protein